MFVSAAGLRRCHAQRYSCLEHGVHWSLPLDGKGHTRGASVVGDVVGKFIISSTWWPQAIRIFMESESYDAVARHLRDITEAHVSIALVRHPTVARLEPAQQQLLHIAILQHCLACPSWQTMRSWISLYKRMCVVCAPQPLCKGILRCYCIQKIQKMLCHYCYTWMSCLTRCFPSEPKICSRSLADLLQGKTCITNSFLLIRLHFSDILFFTLAE